MSCSGYRSPAKIIGLTGQSGAGKTTVSEYFSQNGFGVINCDIIARKVTEPMGECVFEIRKAFPGCVDDKTMTLDRRALADIVFSDKEKLEVLNGIIFRYIRCEIDRAATEMEYEYKYILLDAPTLFEAGADKKCDIIVSVTAAEDIRLERIMERDGLDKAAVKKRFSSQHSTSFFEEHSDYVIRNDGSAEDVLRQTEDVIKKIKGRLDGGKG